MISWALLLAALAVALVPVGPAPRPAVGPLRADGDRPDRIGERPGHWRTDHGVRYRRRRGGHALARILASPPAAFVVVLASVMLAGDLALLPASVLGVVAGALVRAVARFRVRRAAAREVDDAAAVVAALADELRAGRSPPQALEAVAEHHAGPVAAVLGEAARTERLGGDTEVVLRVGAAAGAASGRLWARTTSDGRFFGVASLRGPAAASLGAQPADASSSRAWPIAGSTELEDPSSDGPEAGPSGECLLRIAAAWRLSRSAGCSLAEVLDAVALDLKARRRQQRLLTGLLAGPRASAGLLAALPVVGLVMGAALGADPLTVLTATGPGQVALVVGVALDLAGVAWTARLVKAAG